MEYYQTIQLKDGRECVLRSAAAADGAAVLENFILTHGQTDYLRTYPEEAAMTAEQEGRFLQNKADSPDEVQIVAVVDGAVAGMAGISRVGTAYKVRHRAELGVSVDKAYWGLGIGRALTKACIACAAGAGYAQLELDAVADNARALALYESLGFTEFGRNPLGFRSRVSGWQALVHMRLELDGVGHQEAEE